NTVNRLPGTLYRPTRRLVATAIVVRQADVLLRRQVARHPGAGVLLPPDDSRVEAVLDQQPVDQVFVQDPDNRRGERVADLLLETLATEPVPDGEPLQDSVLEQREVPLAAPVVVLAPAASDGPRQRGRVPALPRAGEEAAVS